VLPALSLYLHERVFFCNENGPHILRKGYYYYCYYYYKRRLLECRAVKKTLRALNNKQLKVAVSHSSVTHWMNSWRLTSSAIAWRWTTMVTQWCQMTDCSKCKLQRFQRRGHRRWHDALVECSARVLKQNKVAVKSPFLPHGAVHIQGMAEPCHASNGRQAQRAWTQSTVARVTNVQ